MTQSAGSPRRAGACAQVAPIGRTHIKAVPTASLSSLSDPDLVPNAVGSALGVRETPDRTPIEALAAFLEAKGPLIVLDNCEHLIWACAALVDVLLRSCPGLQVLATSP